MGLNLKQLFADFATLAKDFGTQPDWNDPIAVQAWAAVISKDIAKILADFKGDKVALLAALSDLQLTVDAGGPELEALRSAVSRDLGDEYGKGWFDWLVANLPAIIKIITDIINVIPKDDPVVPPVVKTGFEG
jgi:hypothetical protein